MVSKDGFIRLPIRTHTSEQMTEQTWFPVVSCTQVYVRKTNAAKLNINADGRSYKLAVVENVTVVGVVAVRSG